MKPLLLALVLVIGCSRHGHEHGDGGASIGRDSSSGQLDAASQDAGGDLALAGDGGGVGLPLDVLFVVGSWATMKDEQAALARGLDALTAELRALDGRRADLRFGFMTADVGADGTGSPSADPVCRHNGDGAALQAMAACGLQGGKFATWREDGRVKNFTGTLESTLGCLATVGSMGCRFGQPLFAAMAKASGTREEFVRESAHLLIIIVSNYDDCSAGPTNQYYGVSEGPPNVSARLRCALDGHLCNGFALSPTTFDAPLSNCKAKPSPFWLDPVDRLVEDVKRRKSAPYRTLVGVIAGWPEVAGSSRYRFVEKPYPADGKMYLSLDSTCSSSRGGAEPALRLKAFADAFGSDGTVQSICADDLRPGLKRIGQMVRTALGGP